MLPGKILFIALIAGLIAIGCRENSYKTDISGIQYEAEILRLEKELFGISPAALEKGLDSLRKSDPLIMRYFGYTINAGEITDSLWSERVQLFVTEKFNFELYAETEKKFDDIKWLAEGMTDGWRHYVHYFPGRSVPDIFTCITGFNNSIIVGDSTLGIGIDRYLGSDSKYYPKLGIYGYQADRMVAEKILSDCFYGWASAEWDINYSGYKNDNVLTSIIHEGKLLYFTKCMLPEEEDERIFGFSPDGLSFCRNNEAQMWQYLMEHDLLFSTDRLTIRKLTGEAPYTFYFTNDSPGRAAAWLGFRIVEAYMKNSRGVSLPDLMLDTDVEKILEKARYRPR